jgi:hypothetical protein
VTVPLPSQGSTSWYSWAADIHEKANAAAPAEHTHADLPDSTDLTAFGIHRPQDHGAVADGTTDDTAAFTAARNALIATGGGTLLIPPDIYRATLTLNTTDPIHVLGYGAELRAPANDATLVTINQGVGTQIKGARIDGLTLNGTGRTGVTGMRFEDTDGATASHLYVVNCATGIDFVNVDNGMWTERCAVHDSYVFNCSSGIVFRKEAGNPSFNEIALVNVGVSGCPMGIDQRVGTDFTRTTWDNVTVWPAQDGVGVKFDGQIDHSRLTFGVEALQTGITGIEVGTNFTFYADAASPDLRISFVGEFEERLVDNSTGGGLAWTDGTQHYTSDYAQIFAAWKVGEAWPRFKMNIDGLRFGHGTSLPISMLPWYDDFMKMAGRYVFDNPASVGSAAEPSPGTALDVGGVLRLANTTMPPDAPTGGGFLISDGGVLKHRAPTGATGSFVGYVNHGATASTARPGGFGMVIWTGSVEPANWVDGDQWVQTS